MKITIHFRNEDVNVTPAIIEADEEEIANGVLILSRIDPKTGVAKQKWSYPIEGNVRNWETEIEPADLYKQGFTDTQDM